jgi:hypothetical protein
MFSRPREEDELPWPDLNGLPRPTKWISMSISCSSALWDVTCRKGKATSTKDWEQCVHRRGEFSSSLKAVMWPLVGGSKAYSSAACWFEPRNFKTGAQERLETKFLFTWHWNIRAGRSVTATAGKRDTKGLGLSQRWLWRWDIAPCSPLSVNRRLGGICRLHLQGWRISRARDQRL